MKKSKMLTISSVAFTMAAATLSICKAKKKAYAKNKDTDLMNFYWLCPACGVKHYIKGECTSKVQTCTSCQTKTKLLGDYIGCRMIKKGSEERCCKNCKHYINKEGNWYFRRGNGTCTLDKKDVKQMKAPCDLCSFNGFTQKDTGGTTS